jgi:hypothetical protein
MPLSMNNTTLTFNDASTQTTSAVTAVNVSTGISSSGGKTPTLTNTGVTSIVAGTGISISGGTGAVTITNSQPGAVSSVNGQTGAVVNTSLDAIGSCALVIVGTSLSAPAGLKNTSVGSTIAGSSLRYNFSADSSYFFNQGPIGAGGSVQGGGVSVNATVSYPGGGTSLSGTWRCIGQDYRYYSGSVNDGPSGGVWASGLFVRVS